MALIMPAASGATHFPTQPGYRSLTPTDAQSTGANEDLMAVRWLAIYGYEVIATAARPRIPIPLRGASLPVVHRLTRHPSLRR